MGKRYALVAGGAGFIGSHLVDSLVADGWYVDIIDNLVTGNLDNIKQHLFPVADDEIERKVDFIEQDIMSMKDDPARDNGRAISTYDVVYNLACPASPKAYQERALATVMTNVVGTTNLLAIAQVHKARFVQASTSEVYGDPVEHPQSESYWGNVNSFGPRACYSEDTDVLTSEGWIPISQITLEHKIATADEEKRVTYVTPKEIIVQSFEGNMFHFVNQKIDLLVTPNHLMVDDSKSTRRFIQASANVRWSHLRVPVSGVWPDSNTEKDHVLPEASATEHAMYPQPEEVPYKGNVYCVDLPPNRTLYVRRNGKVCLGSNCYDEGKRCAETICWEFRKSGVDVRVARIFNTYGPRMHPDDGRVISNFVRQAIQGLPLTVYGNGSQTRSFCYVSDLVRGLRMLAEIKTPPTTPVNIGNDCEFKISELAEALTEWFLRIDILNEPLPKDDPKVRKPDLTLARNLLGYKPTVSLREGLVHTIAWMKEKL